MSSRTSEARIEAWLNARIREIGGLSYKFVSPGNLGVPDRIYILPGGSVWFVELKAETGRLAKLQMWQGRRLQAAGCNYRVIKGMDEAKAFVDELQGR